MRQKEQEIEGADPFAHRLGATLDFRLTIAIRDKMGMHNVFRFSFRCWKSMIRTSRLWMAALARP